MTNIPPKLIPHSEVLENKVLGCAIGNAPEFLPVVLDTVTAQDFYAPRRAELFRVVSAMHRAGKAVDPMLVLEACVGNANARAAAEEIFYDPMVLDIEPHCKRLRELTSTRALIRACMQVAADGLEPIEDYDAFLDKAGASLASAMGQRDDAVRSTTLADALGTVLSQLDAKKNPTAPTGRVSTGLLELDRVLGGLQAGKLYVVAGRPGMGKSALGQLFAESSGWEGKRAAVFSLEMPSDEIAGRMLASHAEISARALQGGMLSDEQVSIAVRAADELASLPVVFPEANTFTIEAIRRTARRMRLRGGLGLVLIDYLQLVRSSARHDSREQEVSAISRECKLLARELEVPVVAVAQLNRAVEARADKRPLLSDLRESGAIEQDADAVLMLYREGYYDPKSAQKNVCEVIVAKHRGGPTGLVKVHFAPEFTRFGNLATAAE